MSTINKTGFTLIELSIVLVIIGLIVGGVLVGRDLLRAAEVRATISQIERYNTAVNTFRGKYASLPGDMSTASASQFGFTARGANAGQGDGNGVIEGYTGTTNSGFAQGGGETGLFWVDLTIANGLNVNLVEGGFSKATANPPGSAVNAGSMNLYMPEAKLGGGNFVYVFSASGVSGLGISRASSIDTSGLLTSTPGLTVQQAYAIDKKMDDGLPLGGRVGIGYVTGNAEVISPFAGSPSASTCFDTTSLQYSISQNNGNGVNCAISFIFQ